MKHNTIQLGLVYNHTIVRNALRDYLTKHHDLEVTIDVPDINELLERLNGSNNPDVLLLELDLVASTFEVKEALRYIHNKYPYIRIIIMSVHFKSLLVNELLDCGVHGYLSKSAETSELLDAIKTAARGIMHQNKILLDILSWRANHPQKHLSNNNKYPFTNTQKRILQLLWQEKSTKEIADEVFLSISAVEKIKQQLKEITGTKTTIGLIKYALEQKIILTYPHEEYYLG